jgi:hypothetical protein
VGLARPRTRTLSGRCRRLKAAEGVVFVHGHASRCWRYSRRTDAVSGRGVLTSMAGMPLPEGEALEGQVGY